MTDKKETKEPTSKIDEAPQKKIEKLTKETAKKPKDISETKLTGSDVQVKESYSLAEAINHLKTSSKKRKFTQGFDLIINLKNIDLRKPENKISKEVILPHGRGKEIHVGVISDNVKDAIRKSDIENASKKKTKELIKKHDFFLCEAGLMPFVGKALGKFLAPIGKMPSPFPPTAEITPMVNTKKKTARIRVRDSPVVHIPIGTETMDIKHVEENAKAVIKNMEKYLPKGKNQIKGIYIKLTMTSSLKVNTNA